MTRRRFLFRAIDISGDLPRFRVTQLMERSDGKLRNSPVLVGRRRTYSTLEALLETLAAATGDEIELTRLDDDQELPSSPSSPV
jgi:hypothetical protein